MASNVVQPNSGEAIKNEEFSLEQPNPASQVQPTCVHQLPNFLFDYSSGMPIPSVDALFLNGKDPEYITSQQCNGGKPEERFRQAVDIYKNDNSTKTHHMLTQLWFPVSMEGDLVLQHSGHFDFGPLVNNDPIKKKVLKRYVYDSLGKVFWFDLQSAQTLGVTDDNNIPLLSNLDVGSILVNKCVAYKAFQLQSVQWAPNIHIYPSNFDRYIIFGTLALPVFDCATNQYVGVFELVTDYQYIDYVAEIQKICKFLQELCLRTDTKLVDQPRQMVLVEIMNLLRNASQTHNLPLAQTWLPCKCCGGDHNSLCMCSPEIPFILMDSSLFPFWKASSMYHMCEGQGVAGRAFMSKASCFCNDITQLSDKNFPLVQTSRMFSVSSSLATCLKSSYTGDDIYIVQFFIGNRLTTIKEQKQIVESIGKSIRQNFGSLKFASSQLEEIDARVGKITNRKWVSNICINNVVSSLKTCGVGHLSENVLHNGLAPMVELIANEDVGYKKGRKRKTLNLLPVLKGTRDDAAKELGVSISTVKRRVREVGYKSWNDAQKYYGVSPTKRRSKAHECDVPSSSSASLNELNSDDVGIDSLDEVDNNAIDVLRGEEDVLFADFDCYFDFDCEK